MCLDMVDEKTRTDIKYGYKVFWIKDGKILGEFYNPNGTYSHETPILYKTGKWYKTKDNIIKKDNISYPAGFHVFINKEDAEDWKDPYTGYKTFKVEIADIVASGYQHFRGKKRIIIAKKIKIIGG